MSPKHLPYYIIIILLFCASIEVIFQSAPDWMTSSLNGIEVMPYSIADSVSALLANVHHPLGILLTQLIIIIVAAKAVGAIFRRLKQPAVIGEMLAGILLGPSFFGWLLPDLQGSIFPAASLGAIKTLSEVGIIIFMFSVGAEFDVQNLKKEAHTAILVSQVSLFLPFILGAAFSIFLYSKYAVAGIDFRIFCLFVGIAMSVTAFPVLAGIIRERGMIATRLGNTALACAAVGDVTAWCMLAGIVAISRVGGLGSAMLTVALAVTYFILMLLIVKPIVQRIDRRIQGQPRTLMMATVLFMFVSALVTELIGIHALFGAFLAGVTVSGSPAIRRFFLQYIEPFSVAVLLPLYFAFTGLRTLFALVGGIEGWSVCAALIILASVGKLGGGAFAARVTGLDWRESLKLGTLMNTRGLMELVVLNIGLDLGVLSPQLFAIMVVMALATTFMTGPILTLIEKFPQMPPWRYRAWG